MQELKQMSYTELLTAEKHLLLELKLGRIKYDACRCDDCKRALMCYLQQYEGIVKELLHREAEHLKYCSIYMVLMAIGAHFIINKPAGHRSYYFIGPNDTYELTSNTPNPANDRF